MNVYMRNKASGEIRDVEADSSEFRDLQKEVTALGQPMWEQTNIAHAQAVRDRAVAGDLYEEDLGYEAQDELRYEALKLASEGVAPELNPHLFLTPGEIEAGLTPEQKQRDLQDMYNQKVGRRGEIFSKVADSLAGDREREDRGPTVLQGGTMSALAGGSDDREDAPARGATATKSGSGDGDTPQVQPSVGSPAGSRQPASSSRGSQQKRDDQTGNDAKKSGE